MNDSSNPPSANPATSRDVLEPPRRFWHERIEEVALDPGGFLLDPSTELGHLTNPKAIPLEAVDDCPVVVLLGEPGIGKSTELRALRARLESPDASETVVIAKDLRDYESFVDLRRSVFESREFQEWQSGSHALLMLLDSLDEALLQSAPLADRLASEVASIGANQRLNQRFFLRIACRAAVWPESANGTLIASWGAEKVRTLVLAPLRRTDAARLLSEMGIAGEAAVVERLIHRGLGALAARPISLRLLASIAPEELGELSQVSLYESGCRVLASGSESVRALSRPDRDLTPNQRLAVASRIAACVVFGNKAVVSIDTVPAVGAPNRKTSTADLDDLVGGLEPVGGIGDIGISVRGRDIEVNRRELEETLGSALFHARKSSGRQGRAEGADDSPEFVFAHWSFAEFLAARWVVANRLSIEQMSQLVLVPARGVTKVAPQMLQTAAWISSLNESFRSVVLREDPSVLLRSDAATIGDDVRADLVTRLLELARRDQLDYNVYWMTADFRSLAHDRLVEQLTPVIESESETTAARTLALRISTAVGWSELAEPALRVAFRAKTPHRVRVDAARAAASCAKGDQFGRLRALLELIDRKEGEVGGPQATRIAAVEPESLEKVADPDDQLRGTLLSALWPEYLRVDEVLPFVSEPKVDTFYGAYKHFLATATATLSTQALDLKEIGKVCEWLEVRNRERSDEPRSPLGVVERLEEALWHACWHGIAGLDESETDCIHRLAALAAERARRFEPVAEGDGVAAFEAALASPKRRCLFMIAFLHALTQTGMRNNEEYAGLEIVRQRLLTPGDVPCMLSALREAERNADTAMVLLLAQTIAAFACSAGEPVFETVYREAFPSTPPGSRDDGLKELGSALRWWIGPIDLSSHEAERARDQQRRVDAAYARRNALENERDSESRGREAGIEREVNEQLEALRSGDLDAWWRLNYFFSISDSGLIEEWFSRFSGRRHWDRLPANSRALLIEKAKEYLECRTDRREQWRGSGTPDRPALAGVRAFVLLMETAPSAFRSLDASVFVGWAHAIVAFPRLGDVAETSWDHQLLIHTYRRAPHAIAQAICEVTAFEDARHGLQLVLDRMLDNVTAWVREDVGPLVSALLAMVSASRSAPAPGLSVPGLTSVLGAILQLHSAAGLRLADEMVIAGAKGAAPPGDAAGEDAEAASLPVRAATAPPAARDLRQRAVAAAQALVLGTPDAGWDVLWPALSSNEDFAREVLLGIAGARGIARMEPIARKLREAQLADLFVLTNRLFPASEDPESDGFLGSRHELTWLRESLLEELVRRGTDDAVQAIVGVMKRLPDRDDLSYSRRNAESALRRANWTPTPPAVLLSLPATRGRAIIASERDLADAVQASIRRFALALRGVDAAVGLYWDEVGPARWRPKNEESLATALIAHLRRDLGPESGVTTAREVRIRPPIGKTPAEDVDILVEAIVADRDERARSVQVVVEIKGQWNRGVRSAIQSQLVERYLERNNQSSTGVFVVGWYLCTEWDGSDYRKAAASRNGSDQGEFERELQATAAQLSTARRDVRAMLVDLSLSTYAP